METREFFEAIFGSAEGFLFISTLDSDRELTQHKPYKYPDNLNQIVKYCSVRSDEDLYFSPMLYSVPRRKSEVVKATPVVYSDTDLFDPEGFLVKPSLSIRTSEDKTHSYWFLDQEYSPEEVSSVARVIALTHAQKINGEQAGTDPSGWMLTKLLRVPGSVNTKHEPPYPVYAEDTTGTVYSLDDFHEVYNEADIPDKVVAGDQAMPTGDELPKQSDVLRRMAHDPILMSLYKDKPHGDWSDSLYLFESEMFRAGFTAEEVFAVAWYAECNKYRRDNRPEEDLWTEVKRAGADPANRPRTRLERAAPDEVTPKVANDAAAIAQMELTLLTQEEREQLTETFVDVYARWGESKTDAPAAYHISSAFAIMGCILGEYGIALPKFGPMRLGMFMVVMGETTDTRKSTTRKLMKDIMRSVQVGDWKYILTSDTTPESLLDALSERGNQSSLYDRDETQTLIRDIKNKPYLAGFFETLNELYDGWARGRLRQAKSTEDTPVNFVAYLMGIRSQIQDELEISDFASGWGPRNIFFRGEAPPRTREQKFLQQGNLIKGTVDREKLAIVKQLIDVRNFWQKTVPDRAEPMPIFFEDDAWVRWNKFAIDMEEYVADHPRAELLKPSVQRMAFATMKAAIMFAMMEKRIMANMTDVLNAIYFSLQWLEDLIVVVEGVAESAAARDLQNIEKYILEKGGLLTYAQLLKWSTAQGFRKGDFVEMLRTLVEMGSLDEVEDSRGRKSYSIA